MRVGVVLTIHNGERYLRDQIDSINAQTRRPDKVVVVDDGSTDSSRAVLRRSGIDDCASDVRVLCTSPLSRPDDVYSRVRNAVIQGVRACEDVDCIAFADQDDIWHPQHLAFLVDALESSTEVSYAFSNASFIDETGRPLSGTLFAKYRVPVSFSSRSRARQLGIIMRRPIVTGTTMIIRQDVASHLEMGPSGMLHDRWASMVGLSFGRAIAINKCLTSYRLHDGQVVGVTGNRVWPKAQRAFHRFLDPHGDEAAVAALRAMAPLWPQATQKELDPVIKRKARNVYVRINLRRILGVDRGGGLSNA